MDKQQISKLKDQFDSCQHKLEGSSIEFCYARELMGLLGYRTWENFAKVINKEKTHVKTA